VKRKKQKTPKTSKGKTPPPSDDYTHRTYDWEKDFTPSPTKPLLPCGHQNHPEKLEAKWRSPEFQEHTSKQHTQFERLIKYLRSKTLRRPQPPFPRTAEAERVFAVKEYFRILMQQFGKHRNKYNEHVNRYEEANYTLLEEPPCLRENIIFPLDPLEIEGMVQLEALRVPRTGGRPASERIRERNRVIRELQQQGLTARQICKKLDERGRYIVPASWGLPGWSEAYLNNPKRVDTIFSKLKKE